MTGWAEAGARLWAGWMWPMLWQSSLLILVVACIDRLIRRWAWPQVRLALWSLVLLKLILPPSLASPFSITSSVLPWAADTWAQVAPSTEAHPDAPRIEPAVSTPLTLDLLDAPQTALRHTALTRPPAQPAVSRTVWFASAWALIASTLLVCVIVRWRQLRRQILGAAQPASAPAWLADAVAAAAHRLGLRRLPRVVVGRHGPAVFGAFNPTVILPANALAQMSPAEVEHVLMHELAHVKRFDLVHSAAAILLQIGYWHNPLVWFARRRLHDIRELCCDATVAQVLREETSHYRETLLRSVQRLLNRRADQPSGLIGMFQDPDNMLARLRWLEGRTWRFQGLRRLSVGAVCVGMLLFVVPMMRTPDPAPLAPAPSQIATLPAAPMGMGWPIYPRPRLAAIGIANTAVDQLCAAADAGDLAQVRQILKKEPRLIYSRGIGSALNRRLMSPLHHAASAGSVELIKFLLSKGADLNSRDPDNGWTPLQVALDRPDRSLATWMVDHGAQVDLFAAAGLGDARRVRDFIERDPGCVHDRGPSGATPLHFASTIEVAELLLDAGADPEVRDNEFHSTAVRWHTDHPEVGRLLAARGAKTDIFIAAALNDAPRVAAMLDANPRLIDARTDDRDMLGPWNTPLRLAAAMGRDDVARLLLDRGADLHARGGIAKATPLHAAAWYGHPTVARLLIERGAQIEARDEQGRRATPLDWAVLNARKDMVELLLARGAGLTAEMLNNARAGASGNLRPFSVANPNDYQPILDLLREYQSRPPAGPVDRTRALRFMV